MQVESTPERMAHSKGYCNQPEPASRQAGIMETWVRRAGGLGVWIIGTVTSLKVEFR